MRAICETENTQQEMLKNSNFSYMTNRKQKDRKINYCFGSEGFQAFL